MPRAFKHRPHGYAVVIVAFVISAIGLIAWAVPWGLELATR